MKLAELSITKKVITFSLTLLALGGGLLAFNGMSRLEDPEFTIKEALVITSYPGASAPEVVEEVTDRLEKEIQKLGEVDWLESKTDRGLSSITVRILSTYGSDKLPQIWDKLRNKVGDIQRELPPGVQTTFVQDDFGDVYGIFLAITGEGYSYAELKDVVDLLRRELLLVQGVAKIDTYGERKEAVYIELNRTRLSQLGISPQRIVQELKQKNVVSDSGRIQVGPEYLSVEPTGTVQTVKQFEWILLSEEGERQIFLKDVANVRRGYVEPQDKIMRFDGHPAIGMGFSTVAGGNVVDMGEALRARLAELEPQIPLGIDIETVSFQSDAVVTAINGFLISLIEAIAIVIVILLFFMGVRSGIIIGFVLGLTMVGSFVFLHPMGVALERISLGALIIALGMLVDNAIVVVDGTLVRIQQGMERKKAAIQTVGQSAMPLLGATLIAILTFAIIGASPDSTGEFCRSLFQVATVSLGFSWLTAVTITPLLCVLFLKAPPADQQAADPYGGKFYTAYRNFLKLCIRRRWATVAVVGLMFAMSLFGFRYVSKSFFPASTRPQFMLDLWYPKGVHIDETAALAQEVAAYVRDLEGVTHTSEFVGQGALRFILTYVPEKIDSGYAQVLVDVEDYRIMSELMARIETDLQKKYPDVQAYTKIFDLGPGKPGKIRARFSGPNNDVLRGLSEKAMAVMHEDGKAKAIRTNWRERVKVIKPIIAEEQANLNGIERADVAHTIAQGFEGARVGVYREKDLLLPIILRAPQDQRLDIQSVRNLQIWSPAGRRMIPLRQVVKEFKTEFEDTTIWRRNRRRTIEVISDPTTEEATTLFNRLRPQIEAIPLPTGYELEWGGQYEDSRNAQGPLMAAVPIFVVVMFLLTILLFNSIRQPVVIWLCVPLAVIGVSVGLLVTKQPFGFMSLLGFMSLCGMLIKNAIVLIDEMNAQQAAGQPPLDAVVTSGVNRLRPVAMAALTTALGMVPLLADAFFVAMAVTIIFGLMFATVLTMVVVPVFYTIFYRIRS